MNQEYHKYLNSDTWKTKRKKVIMLRKGKCEKCNSTQYLHVHHLHYRNIFQEKMEDLQLLCESCHSIIHKPKQKKRKKQKELISLDLLIKTISLSGYKVAANLLKKARRSTTGTLNDSRAKKYVKKYIKRRRRKTGFTPKKIVFTKKYILRKGKT